MGAPAALPRGAKKRRLAAACAGGWCVVALVASCSSDDDIRRGGAGESCLRTDDCVSPLACIQNVCGGPATTGIGGQGAGASGGSGGGGASSAGHGGAGATGGDGGTGAHAAGGAGASSGGHGGAGASGADGGFGGQGGAGGELPWCPGIGDTVNACDECLDTTCHAEACACDDDCFAIEACLETVCRALTDSEESACMVYCQNLHLGGKQAHLDVAWCSYYDTVCAPSCPGGYPQSYPDCRLAVQQGSCTAAWAACEGSVDCLLYRDCTTACATLQDCLACSDTAETLAARQLYESWERCVAAECIAESWW